MPPRNLVFPGQQVVAPVAPSAPQAAPQRELKHTSQAVPLAPVGEEVGSAPVTAVPMAPPTPRRAGQVPLAPLNQAPAPEWASRRVAAPAPEPEMVVVRQSNLPLAPTTYVPAAAAPVAAPAPQPVAAPPAPAPVPAASTVSHRSRLPLAPVGFVPTEKPAAAAPAPVAPVTVTPPPAPAPKPVAAKPAPVVATPAVSKPAPAPAPAQKQAPRRRLPIAPVVDDGSVALPPVPANLVR